MTRYLKTLGLALVSVFAMSAIVTSAAWAHTFTLETSPTTLTAKQEAPNNNKFKILGQNVECETATFEATVTGVTKTEITGIVPFYGKTVSPPVGEKCFYAGQEAIIHVDTCTYTLTGTTDGAGDTQVKIANCVNPLTITVPTLNCQITIFNQTATEGVKYTNIGTAPTSEVTIDLTAKVSITVETITNHVPNVGCFEIESVTTGRLTGQVLVTGENPTNGAHQGITVS